jgi:hypothetical protein
MDAVTHGRVSKNFQKFATEVYSNISVEMGINPRSYSLNVCKTLNDLEKALKNTCKKHRLNPGVGFYDYCSILPLQIPETFITEDVVKGGKESLEEVEGSASHELGHIRDRLDDTARFFSPTNDPLVYILKAEHNAEKNAIEAGYYSGIFNKRYNVLFARIASPSDLHVENALNLAAYQAAFMSSIKPPVSQKKLLETIWDKVSDIVAPDASFVMKSDKIKKHPEMFGDDNFLKEFSSDLDKWYQKQWFSKS